jgi:16S rRNA G966 N2-methylase RsmD
MLDILKTLRGKGYKRRLQNPKDEFYDRVFRVKTFAYKKYSDDWYDPVWKGDYMPTKYQGIFDILKTANVDETSVIIDFGCGLGRVVFAAAHLGAKYSIGVEFDEELFQAAESNRLTSKFPDKVSFVHQDAAVYKIPNDANVFFFFNPFGSAIMSDVIKNIEESLKITPRKICIIYYNPMFTDTLQSSDVLKLQEEWPAEKVEYVVQFWGN